jgi:hypothetical protein
MTVTAEAEVQLIRPEFFRLPKPGTPGGRGRPAKPAQGDPYFGFSRSFYYEGEKRGYWKLIRSRGDGKERGVTLIPYASVLKFVRNRVAESNSEFDAERGDGVMVEQGRPQRG